MQQLSLFSMDFTSFFDAWCAAMKEAHDQENVYSLNLAKDEKSCSVFMYDRLIYKLVERKSGMQLHLSAAVINLPNVIKPSFAPLKKSAINPNSASENWYVYLVDEIDLSAFYAWSLKAKEAVFRTLGDVSFACCNDFVRCSDQLACLHPHDVFYNHCYYRKNLELGKVFYGKNKNV